MTSADAEGGFFERFGARARALAPSAGFGGNRRTLLAYAAFTVVFFVVCFLATFPHDLMLQRALRSATASTPFRIETGAGSLGWTLAYGLESLRVRGKADDGDPLLLAEALRVAPSRFGLLMGNPFPVGIDAALYGGSLRGVVDPRPGSFRLDATVEGVDLARYPWWRTWFEGAVRGRVDGVVSVTGDARGPAAAGTVALKIPGLALEGIRVQGYGVPDLHFTDVHLDGTVKNGRLEVSELVGRGQEVDVVGEGNVLLREPIETSVLSLDVTVTPVAGAPKGYDVVVGMLPGTSGAGGARRMNVVGTLGKPKLR